MTKEDAPKADCWFWRLNVAPKMADVAEMGLGCCFKVFSRGAVVGMASVDPDLSDGAEEASEPISQKKKKGGGCNERSRREVATVGYERVI